MENKKKWQIPAGIRIPPEIIAAAGDAVVAEILYRRGYTTVKEITTFLQREYAVADFTGHALLVPLVERIEQAISRREKITVYGDYDVDGITSTALWLETLHCLGADADYHVPHRFKEGYGINAEVMRALAVAGTKLVITCDCGISNYVEIEAAKVQGIDVLVTDHHEIPAMLPDVPIFNPKMLPPDHPSFMLPGVGVSFIVAKELLRRAGKESYTDRLQDLLALGIIADVVPLTKDNRWYLKQGLPYLLASERPGLKALLELTRIDPVYGTEEDVAFQVIPRLNAAGRLDTASLAVELLLTTDLSEANKLAAELNRLNETRKALCERMLRESLDQMEEQAGELPAIVLYKESWHEGVMGIVAGRLAEQHLKPSLLMTRKENGLITGSARSAGKINIYLVLLACQDLLVKFGGHEGAAGFSLHEENLAQFRQKVLQTISEMTTLTGDEEPLLIDARLSPEQVNMDLYRRVRDIGPFGAENPVPVFFLEGELVSNQLMKTGSAHRRLRFAKSGRTAEAVWWQSGQTVVEGHEQFVAKLRLNLFRDNVNLQLDIQDMIGIPVSAPASLPSVCALVDMRGRASEELAALFPQGLFFGEGEKHRQGRSRLDLAACDTLVVTTLPPSPKVWSEILQKAAPREVVLAWNITTLQSQDQLTEAWRHLMGIIKYSLRMHEGIITPQRAAARLGWTRELLAAGLLILADVGLIKAIPLDAERLSLSICGDRLPDLHKVQSFRRFAKMIREKEAYRNYMRQLPVEKLREELFGCMGIDKPEGGKSSHCNN